MVPKHQPVMNNNELPDHQVTTNHHQSHGLFVHQAATASGTVGMSVVTVVPFCAFNLHQFVTHPA